MFHAKFGGVVDAECQGPHVHVDTQIIPPTVFDAPNIIGSPVLVTEEGMHGTPRVRCERCVVLSIGGRKLGEWMIRVCVQNYTSIIYNQASLTPGLHEREVLFFRVRGQYVQRTTYDKARYTLSKALLERKVIVCVCAQRTLFETGASVAVRLLSSVLKCTSNTLMVVLWTIRRPAKVQIRRQRRLQCI